MFQPLSNEGVNPHKYYAMKILVVDDNIMDRKYIKYLLENHLNISPDTAKDGIEALKKVKSSKFDLVITDVVMPKNGGC